MPCDYKLYPDNWKELRQRKLKAAGHRCQGSPKFPDCRAKNYEIHPVTGSIVILGLCHFDRDIKNNKDENLRIWCQRCHINHDITQHVFTRKYGEYNHPDQLQINFNSS